MAKVEKAAQVERAKRLRGQIDRLLGKTNSGQEEPIPTEAERVSETPVSPREFIQRAMQKKKLLP